MIHFSLMGYVGTLACYFHVPVIQLESQFVRVETIHSIREILLENLLINENVC